MPVNSPLPTLVSSKSVTYLDPVGGELRLINDVKEAFRAMRDFGLGINQKHFENFLKNVPSEFDGRILINIDDLGKAYIADAVNGKLIYLGSPENAFKVFGEYAPRMITGKDWTWVKTVMNDDSTITPKNEDVFTIKFNEDMSFSGTTDCNSFFGQYEKSNDDLSLGNIASTRMFCENSQELEFTKALGEVEKFLFNDEGNLVMTLKFDSGLILLE